MSAPVIRPPSLPVRLCAIEVSILADELLAIEAVIFLVSGLLTYAALKQRQERRKYPMGKVADGIFVAAFALLILLCGAHRL